MVGRRSSTDVYIEGGGRKDLDSRAREAFSMLFEASGMKGRLPRVHPSGSRLQAYKDFCTAVASKREGCSFLLVDSEDVVAPGDDAWAHLGRRQADQWSRPPGAEPFSAHLMVQCMETWFLADVTTLQNYYGQNFKKARLPRNSSIESVDKQLLFRGLEAATKGTSKGSYSKGKHSFEILGLLDPAKIRVASRFACKFFVAISEQSCPDAKRREPGATG